MMCRMCIQRIYNLFYNYKRINPFCKFCDWFQDIYLHQSLHFFMECILEMYSHFSRYVLSLNRIFFQFQFIRISWKFPKTLEDVCIHLFPPFLESVVNLQQKVKGVWSLHSNKFVFLLILPSAGCSNNSTKISLNDRDSLPWVELNGKILLLCMELNVLNDQELDLKMKQNCLH